MYVSLCVSLYVSLYLTVRASVRVPFYMFCNVSLVVYLCLCPPICPRTYVWMYLFAYVCGIVKDRRSLSPDSHRVPTIVRRLIMICESTENHWRHNAFAFPTAVYGCHGSTRSLNGRFRRNGNLWPRSTDAFRFSIGCVLLTSSE